MVCVAGIEGTTNVSSLTPSFTSPCAIVPSQNGATSVTEVLDIRSTELQDYIAAFHSVHSCSQSLLLFQLNAHNIVIVVNKRSD